MEFVKDKIGKDCASIVAEYLMPSKKKVLKHYENVQKELGAYEYCGECRIARIYWRLKSGDYNCYVCEKCAMTQNLTYHEFLKIAKG